MKPCMLSLFVLTICSIVVRECTACDGKDCPQFDVIYTKNEIQIRSYSQALWAASPPYPQTSVLLGLGRGLQIVAGYFYRENDQKVRFSSQPPVSLVEVDDNNNYTLNLYIPEKYQNGSLPLPKPDDPTIKLVKLPKNKFAAVIRGTDLDEDKIAEKIDELKRGLQGTPYERAAALLQFSVVIFDPFDLREGNFFEILIWFD